LEIKYLGGTLVKVGKTEGGFIHGVTEPKRDDKLSREEVAVKSLEKGRKTINAVSSEARNKKKKKGGGKKGYLPFGPLLIKKRPVGDEGTEKTGSVFTRTPESSRRNLDSRN